MTTATTDVSVAREPLLLGQTVVVIGGSAGIGLETARLARREGGEVVIRDRWGDHTRGTRDPGREFPDRVGISECSPRGRALVPRVVFYELLPI